MRKLQPAGCILQLGRQREYALRYVIGGATHNAAHCIVSAAHWLMASAPECEGDLMCAHASGMPAHMRIHVHCIVPLLHACSAAIVHALKHRNQCARALCSNMARLIMHCIEK